ncbi:MFS transporter [Kribbella swartbergensis]
MSSHDAHAVRRHGAKLGTAAMFLLTGLVFATWAARIPARRAELGLSESGLAVAFVGLNAGAVIGLQVGAVVVSRWGSRRTLTVALPAFALSLVPIAWAPGIVSLTVTLALSAVFNSIVDVAINEQGVGLQQSSGRSLLSRLHAMHSLGGVVGGVAAGAAAAVGITVAAHFLIIALLAALAGVVASRRLLPTDDLHGPGASAAPRPSLLTGWYGRLLLLGVLAFVFTLAEGGALDWAAVLLHDNLGSSAAVAAVGVATFQGALTVGRFIGDRLVDRLGPVTVFGAGALIAGGGMTGGLLLASPWTALVGLAALGLGLANLLPISITAAGAQARLPVAVAVARVSALGYLGSFTGPVLIGATSQVADLRIALVVPALAVAATAIAARAVQPPQHTASRTAHHTADDTSGNGEVG